MFLEQLAEVGRHRHIHAQGNVPYAGETLLLVSRSRAFSIPDFDQVVDRVSPLWLLKNFGYVKAQVHIPGRSGSRIFFSL